MTSIGNLDTARMLFKHFDGDPFAVKRAPVGFNRIGTGAYRSAILEKSTRTVYKIGDYDSNVQEAANSRRLRNKSTRNLGFELIIPTSRTFRMPNGFTHTGIPYRRCVVAQEFAPSATYTYCNAQDDWMGDKAKCNCKSKSPVCWDFIHRRIIEFTGLTDIHSGNVLMDKSNRFWLIDMDC